MGRSPFYLNTTVVIRHLVTNHEAAPSSRAGTGVQWLIGQARRGRRPSTPAKAYHQCNPASTSAFARITSTRLIFCEAVSSPFSMVKAGTMACLRTRSVTESR